MLYVSWDPILIGISFVVAFIAAFVALDSATKIGASNVRGAMFWRVCGGATLGMGIWSMHFVGMLAMKMPIMMHYDIALTIASFAVALVAATLALNVAVSKEKLSFRRLLLATFLFGGGVVTMHSLGMMALKGHVMLTWDTPRLVFAITIAFLASGLALWLAFGRKLVRHHAFINHVLAALVMGVTICSMHYLAMSAVEFSNVNEAMSSTHSVMEASVSETGLSIWVSTSTLIVLSIMLFISLIDSQIRTSRLTDNLRQLNMQLEKLAYFDPLTNLPNRLQFDNRLDKCLTSSMASHSRFALLFMDLDRFKEVNDVWGHHVGDLLLKSVSTRLLACISSKMTLSRMGGDEFILLVPDSDDDDVTLLAEHLVESVHIPFYELGHVIKVSLSVGISFFPSHGDSAQDLKFKADAAMYNVKQKGRNGWEIWHPAMELPAANTPVYLSDIPMGGQ